MPSDGDDDSGRRILRHVQRAIETLYRVHTASRVEDFLITDEDRTALGVVRAPREQLLLRHDATASTLDVGLFVDELSLKRLANAAPSDEPHSQELLLAVEGVSHFVYVMLRAQAERTFSGLELELQAEVDKFLLLLLGMRLQGRRPKMGVLRKHLYREIRFDDNLSDEERDRYRTANSAADVYAATLEQRFLRHDAVDDMLDEVRRFYRLDCTGKLDRIARHAA